jgi:plasmid stability protein
MWCYYAIVRTTIRIDDTLLSRLKERALREHTSLTRVLDRVLRAGLQLEQRPAPRKRPYREQTHAMGSPASGLDKALTLAARLEDEETVRKLALRK